MGDSHARKAALGQVCLRVMERVHNVYGVRVANLCKKGRCPPAELELRLKYKRTLLGLGLRDQTYGTILWEVYGCKGWWFELALTTNMECCQRNAGTLLWSGKLRRNGRLGVHRGNALGGTPWLQC